ncbi:MAG: TerB family tellurite resistance protein [Saprospiraceae bacterium]
MKPSIERLHDAMGELIYAVAKADGLIQESEMQKLEEILQKHPWASNIHWSFNYEQNRNNSLEEAYTKALETCKEYGPSEEYEFLFEVLYEIAKASNGLNAEEAQLIVRFKLDLKEHFMQLDMEE